MAELKARIESDMRASAKAQDVVRRDTLRFALAALHNEEVAQRRELTDEEIVGVLTKQAKMRRESIEAFEKGGRAELVAKETAELKVIEGYLPQQLDRDEIVTLARAAIAETGAASPQDQGKVMQKLMPRVKGRAEGKVVATVVTELLRGIAGAEPPRTP
ncbi:MAG: GatB/YqeY domain-containing protein [Chloroflexota bacterium]|nr:GatB/YqeY domain-containing protein [Chloroflexota bacterium]MDE3192876.1 GatB/YqeY domain-containing protein [Chloroflexota bacterium]